MKKESIDWVLSSLISFIGGIIYASFLGFEQWRFWLIFGLFSILTSFLLEFLFKKEIFFSLILLILFFFILGGSYFQSNLENFQRETLIGKKINLIVTSEPVQKDHYQKFFGKELNQDLNFLIYLPASFQIEPYSCLEIEGKVKPAILVKNIGYRNYLLSMKVSGIAYYPKVKRIACRMSWKRSFLKSVYQFKEKTKEIINFSLPDLQARFLSALILGDKDEIPDEWKEKLNNTGLRHIMAISGMHITIWITILMEGLILLGFWRGQAFYLTITFLLFYLILIGLPASAVRAGIMAGLFLIAQKFGYLAESIRLVIMAAFLMLVLNPFLIYNVGFQLSVLAILGIIYLSPFFEEIFEKFKLPELVKKTLAMTLSAQFFVTPIIAYNFNYFSVVSPITNLLIVPFLPFIILAGIFLIFLGLINLQLTLFVNWFLILIFSYIFQIIEIFSRIPQAVVEIENLSFLIFILYYFFLSLVTYFIIKQRKLYL
jgi:competence protein ComEC